MRNFSPLLNPPLPTIMLSFSHKNFRSFDPEIDRTFHSLVRHHLVPFEHPEHYVIGDFEHYNFEHSDFEHSEPIHTTISFYSDV